MLSLASILALEVVTRGVEPKSAPATQAQLAGLPAANFKTPTVVVMPGVPAVPQTMLVAMQEAGLLTAVAATAGIVVLAARRRA